MDKDIQLLLQNCLDYTRSFFLGMGIREFSEAVGIDPLRMAYLRNPAVTNNPVTPEEARKINEFLEYFRLNKGRKAPK